MARDIRIYNVVIDIVIFVITVAVLVLFYLCIFDVVPLRFGFYCDDPDIRYPYLGDTVSELMLVVCVLLPPVAVFIIGEVLFYFLRTRRIERRRHRCWPFKLTINPLLVRIYQIVALYFFGETLNAIFTLLGKRLGGQLRPHFLATCVPDYSLFNCSDVMITGDVCTGNSKDIQDAIQSFPSGHASTSFYSMMFLAIYIQARLLWRSARLVKPFLQVVCLFVASFCALSRIYDRRHHPIDVLAGTALGITIAVFLTYAVSDLFKKKQKFALDKEEEEEDNEMKYYRTYYQQHKRNRRYEEERYL
ncbi:phospholipid phosphatase 3-like [Saccoglossus kowalevskii]